MEDLCLIPDVVIPPKFKVPDFDKYKGTTCPKNHLKVYCRKMGAHTKDEIIDASLSLSLGALLELPDPSTFGRIL